MRNPFLIGKTIYLRTIEASDLDENYQSWFNDAEVCQFNSHHRFPNYRQNMEEYYDDVIKSKNNLVLAIIDKETNQHVGNIALQDINLLDRTAELAIIIGNKQSWGKGIGREAAKLIIVHGFDSLNLNRIGFGTSEENKAMQKLGESLGFKKEGTMRQALYKNNGFKDIIIFGLLRAEYEAKA